MPHSRPLGQEGRRTQNEPGSLGWGFILSWAGPALSSSLNRSWSSPSSAFPQAGTNRAHPGTNKALRSPKRRHRIVLLQLILFPVQSPEPPCPSLLGKVGIPEFPGNSRQGCEGAQTHPVLPIPKNIPGSQIPKTPRNHLSTHNQTLGFSSLPFPALSQPFPSVFQANRAQDHGVEQRQKPILEF